MLKTLVTKTKKIAQTISTISIVALLAACAGQNTKIDDTPTPLAAEETQASTETERTRAMEIFFYQSQVGDAVMNAYPFLGSDGEYPELVAAEARMMSACSYLAQAALNKVSGGEPGLRLKFMVFLTLDSCAAAAREVDTLLRGGTALAGNGL